MEKNDKPKRVLTLTVEELKVVAGGCNGWNSGGPGPSPGWGTRPPSGKPSWPSAQRARRRRRK